MKPWLPPTRFPDRSDAMGCCCSSLPAADSFLVGQPEAANSIAPGFPRHVLIQPWQPWTSRGPTSLALVDASNGKQLAHLHMPPPKSFGVGASLVDSAGQPLAFLTTGETSRQHGMFSSSYKVYAPRPAFQGQQPVPPPAGGRAPLAVPGTYLWATVTRHPFTNEATVTDSRGVDTSKAYMYMGFPPHNFKLTLVSGEGVMLCGKTADKRHDVRVAEGYDAALAICVMFAQKLADDELIQTNHNTTGGPSL